MKSKNLNSKVHQVPIANFGEIWSVDRSFSIVRILYTGHSLRGAARVVFHLHDLFKS